LVPRGFGITVSNNLGDSVTRDLSVLHGRYLNDILDQPRAIRATCKALHNSPALERISEFLAKKRFGRLLLTGMGSSYFGLHPLALEVAERGWTPVMLETSELVHYYPQLLEGSTLVIAVSQSGQSAETLRLLKHDSDGHVVLAVTNTVDSPLATQADFTLLTDAGEEFSVSCKTYVATLVALSVLGAVLVGDEKIARLRELETAAVAAENYLRGWKSHVLHLREELEEAKHLFLVGRGSSLAAVGTGALIIKESDHFHAEGMSSAAFRHGPFEMLTPAAFVGVFAGDERTRELNDRLAADVREHGTKCVVISSDSQETACQIPNVSPIVRPIMEILPVQMMTLGLAAIADREPGKFERATKVTVVE
jgi:glutamine---fructose-6-phosphate transaminase (isomerizing)